MSTHSNPSDYPSRHRPLPAPRFLPDHLKSSICASLPGLSPLDCSAIALGFYSGVAGLTLALNALGVLCSSFEAFPGGISDAMRDVNNPALLVAILVLIKSGRVRYVHVGIPCSTWGTLAKLNGGSRSKTQPYGDGSIPKENTENQQLHNMLRIIHALEKVGAFCLLRIPSPPTFSTLLNCWNYNPGRMLFW